MLQKGEIVMSENGKIIPAMPTNQSKPYWMNLEMRFNSTPLSEIIKETERQYNVTITQKKITENYAFTGFLPADNLEKALEIIAKTYHLTFEINQNKVVLSADE